MSSFPEKPSNGVSAGEEQAIPRSPNVDPLPQEAPAWALAYLPLMTAVFYGLAAIAGVSLSVVSVATLAGAAGLILLDRRDLARSGRLARSLSPSTLWCLFPPAYLRRRARRLGAPSAQFWISMACLALAFVARGAVVVEAASQLATTEAAPVTAQAAPADPLPSCTDDASMQDVIKVFDMLAPVKELDAHGVLVKARAEQPESEEATPSSRVCTGKMLATNAQEYPINYAFDIEEGHVIVHVALR